MSFKSTLGHILHGCSLWRHCPECASTETRLSPQRVLGVPGSGSVIEGEMSSAEQTPLRRM